MHFPRLLGTAHRARPARWTPTSNKLPHAEWNLDIQRAITNNLTLDVAYVGNHGFDEEAIVDLNQPALGAGWDAQRDYHLPKRCQLSPRVTTNCTPDSRGWNAADRAYSTIFPYLSNIDETTNGDFSNYDALQATLQGAELPRAILPRRLHLFPCSRAVNDGNTVNGGESLPTDKNNLRLDYGNSAMRSSASLYFFADLPCPRDEVPGTDARRLVG